MLTAKALIEKGYFPDKVVPALKAEKLAEILDYLPPEQLKDIIKNKPQNKSKCCHYSAPRIQNLRRIFAIPNPLHQINLAYCIEDNWDEIKKFISNSPISLSTPKIIQDNDRSFVHIADWREKRQELALRSTVSRTMLKTDISRYYQTIYTHSIPWALLGKEKAKKHKNDDTCCWNNLDFCVRNTMDEQTIGIPTGPDTSHIIAEIIGRGIEKKLEIKLQKEGIKLNGIRYVDDFALFFNSRHDAEITLHKIHDTLRFFELEINPNKTEIVDLPSILEPEWVSNLRHFYFRSIENCEHLKAVRIQNTDIINYFSRAFEYSKKYPNDNTLLYALTRADELKILHENWELFESFILKSALYEGSCIPYTIKILKKYEIADYPLNKPRISSAISEIIEQNSKFSHGFEIAWALWLAKELHIQVEKNIEPIISESDDSVVALVALDLRESGQISQNIDTTFWKNFMVKDQLYDDHWLLAYEANIKKWIPISPKNYITTDPFFKILKQHNVEFYDPQASITDYSGVSNNSGYQ